MGETHLDPCLGLGATWSHLMQIAFHSKATSTAKTAAFGFSVVGAALNEMQFASGGS